MFKQYKNKEKQNIMIIIMINNMFKKEQEEALAYLMPLFHYLVTHNHHFPFSVCPLSWHKSCLTIFYMYMQRDMDIYR